MLVVVLLASDAGGVGGERAAAGLLPRCEGGSQTLPADHTGHTADGSGAERHQANARQDLLSAASNGGTSWSVSAHVKRLLLLL